MFKSIPVVCADTVCRSPFRRGPGQRDIRPGTDALVGRPMEENAIAPLHARGAGASKHRTRQLAPPMRREAALILTTERRQPGLRRAAGGGQRQEVLFDQRYDGGAATDTYRCSRRKFHQVHASIERGVGSWLRYL